MPTQVEASAVHKALIHHLGVASASVKALDRIPEVSKKLLRNRGHSGLHSPSHDDAIGTRDVKQT